MQEKRWHQIKTIFHRAVDTDPAERAGFLREACGVDRELLQEVESLLASDETPGSLLEKPIIEPGVIAGASSSLPRFDGAPSPAPTLPDRCEILRELGRGG